MPELPEVHTTVEGIKRWVVGKTIEDVWSDFHIKTAHRSRQTLKNKKYYENFRKIVKGKKIIGSERRGKNILVHLNNHYTIVIHMKMTGHLMYGATDKFVHLIFKLKNARSTGSGQAKDLVLSDMRKFASVCLVRSEKLGEHEGLKNLGLDALKISLQDFKEKIKRKKNWPIKSALMDQTILAGIGNIYSDEMLWVSGVHPLSRASKVSSKKLAQIFEAMQKILRFSIKHGGDSKSDYRNVFGEKGGFQDFHKAYGRKGEVCSKPGCRGIIQRIVVRGRSAHFCSKHQNLHE